MNMSRVLLLSIAVVGITSIIGCSDMPVMNTDQKTTATGLTIINVEKADTIIIEENMYTEP